MHSNNSKECCPINFHVVKWCKAIYKKYMNAPGCLKSPLAPIVDMYTQLTLHQLVRHPEASRTWHPGGGRAVGGVRAPARAARILGVNSSISAF